MCKKILGLDTGTTHTGYCLINCDTQEILDSGRLENSQVFKIIDQCDILALEVIRFQGKSKVGNDVFITSQWVGRYFQCGVGLKKEIYETTKIQHSTYHIDMCWNEHGKLFKGNNDSQLNQSLTMLFPNNTICRDNDARNAYSVAKFILDRYINASY